MLNKYARPIFTKLFTPLASVLLRLGVSPDVVTVVGTLGVSLGALLFYPRGEFLVGTLVITAFVFSDTVDGIMARRSGRSSVSVSTPDERSWRSVASPVLDAMGRRLYVVGRKSSVIR